MAARSASAFALLTAAIAPARASTSSSESDGMSSTDDSERASSCGGAHVILCPLRQSARWQSASQ